MARKLSPESLFTEIFRHISKRSDVLRWLTLYRKQKEQWFMVESLPTLLKHPDLRFQFEYKSLSPNKQIDLFIEYNNQKWLIEAKHYVDFREYKSANQFAKLWLGPWLNQLQREFRGIKPTGRQRLLFLVFYSSLKKDETEVSNVLESVRNDGLILVKHEYSLKSNLRMIVLEKPN